MPTCPTCGNFVSSRAFVCRYCKTLLVRPGAVVTPTDSSSSDSTIKVVIFPDDRVAHSESPAPPSPDDTATVYAVTGEPDLLEPLHADEIALLIEGERVPLIVSVTESVVIGRYSQHMQEQPHIDLVPYGAFEKGVSRFHALFRRVDGKLMVEDLASSNGTWLNGRRLETKHSVMVQSGDYLRFGQLRMQAQFKTARVKYQG
ncbi:MAG: FHA domain-containing protein [Anaerolineae bacterium]|nr:FHA domain-containing protein [Anaerolineae bacterium]